MWKIIHNFFKELFFNSSSCAHSAEEFQWRVPKPEKWDTLEVFTATGLRIGKGVASISWGTKQIYVADVTEHHLKEAFFKIESFLGDHLLGNYVLPMATKDYTETKVICVLIPTPTISEESVNALDELQKKWIFRANELYWEHPGNGLIPFYGAD